MRLRLLSLTVTEDCNFRCRYCAKPRRAARMSETTARDALGLFLPFLAPGGFIAFYGGEPLLEFGIVRETVASARAMARRAGRHLRFSLTTNGSLIDDEVLAFLDGERFSVTLSYDGAAQDAQRRKGSGERLRSVIDRLKASPRLRFEVNSVFRPRSVGSLSETVLGLVARGVPRVHFALSAAEPWSARDLARLRRQANRLRSVALGRYGPLNRGPVVNFRDEAPRRLRACNAGLDRLAVDTRGRVWGCALFADLFREGAGAAARRYLFGSVRGGVRPGSPRFRTVLARYAGFSMDGAETSRGPCHRCPRVSRCWICPVAALRSGGGWTSIPDALCRIQSACLSDVRGLTGR
jgi:uncharacterized protein